MGIRTAKMKPHSLQALCPPQPHKQCLTSTSVLKWASVMKSVIYYKILQSSQYDSIYAPVSLSLHSKLAKPKICLMHSPGELTLSKWLPPILLFRSTSTVHTFLWSTGHTQNKLLVKVSILLIGKMSIWNVISLKILKMLKIYKWPRDLSNTLFLHAQGVRIQQR